ncbi:hypothetical protein RRG08_012648 [Elysia crispata]|uniref:Uncharacterized protein n=1 Tax=Elysia crispata TaxID=231223 RepID=A0AAE0YNQ3_9GAST|nr:hypothetical protein RRG08_012648 [Elysia crispata]
MPKNAKCYNHVTSDRAGAVSRAGGRLVLIRSLIRGATCKSYGDSIKFEGILYLISDNARLLFFSVRRSVKTFLGRSSWRVYTEGAEGAPARISALYFKAKDLKLGP